MNRLQQKINDNEIYFIAEMSANHGGKLENALEIVRQASKTGADCIKIQTYTEDSMTIDCDRSDFVIKGGLWDGYKLYDLYKEASTPYSWQKSIKEECEKCGMDFLSTPFDKAGVDFLNELDVTTYKIASFELVDIPLIEYAASFKKTMIISTGMGTLEEIQDAVEACRRMGNNDIILLKCCSEYPSNWEDMYLGNIPDMKRRFSLPIGLSDHSLGSLAAVVGASLGACVIEKHIKLQDIESVDSEFSMTINEYSDMVKNVLDAKKIMRGPNYSRTEGEKKSLVFRRSIYAVENIELGEVFTEENIRVIRPSFGLAPKLYKNLIGKKSDRKYKRGEPIE